MRKCLEIDFDGEWKCFCFLLQEKYFVFHLKKNLKEKDDLLYETINQIIDFVEDYLYEKWTKLKTNIGRNSLFCEELEKKSVVMMNSLKKMFKM